MKNDGKVLPFYTRKMRSKKLRKYDERVLLIFYLANEIPFCQRGKQSLDASRCLTHIR